MAMTDMSGMMGGAATGMVGGPVGAAIGAGAGLFSDIEKHNEKEKAEAAARPKNRRMTALQDALNAYREQKMAGQLSLSQAAFDWGNSLRL